MWIISTVLFLLVFSYFAIQNSQAAEGINRTINFQGKLTNTNGTNVTDGNFSIVFSIYDVSSGGTALWTETQATVSVTDGIFVVALGSSTAFPADFNFNWDGRYLGINVAGDGEMTPRIRLTAVPYAFNSEKVSGLTVQDTSGNASTSGTLQIPNAETINLGNNSLTFTTSGDSTLTLPTTGTLATLAGTEEFTNKTIGSTGLVFSGASTDITTATDEDLTVTPNGTGNLIFTSDFDSGVTIGTAISNEFPLLIRNGIGNNAALAIDNLNSGDLITASASGTTKFNIENDGDIVFAGSTSFLTTLTSATGNDVTLTIPDSGSTDTLCLLTLANCGAGGAAGTWTISDANGTINPINNTVDILVGGTASSSAKFAVLNIDSGTPTASISANSGDNALYLAGDGNITTTNMQTLTLGGSSTGNVVINAGTNVVLFDSSDTTLTATGLATITSAATLGISATTLDLGNGSAATISTTTNGLTLDSGNNIITFAADDTTLTASGLTTLTTGAGFTIDSSSYVRIGDTGTPTTASTDDDLYVEGDLEVGATATISGNLTLAGGPRTIETEELDTLTLGSSTTGDIVIDSGTSTVNLADYTDCTLKTDASGDVTCGGITASTSDAIGAKAYKNGTQSIPNVTNTAVEFDNEDWDTSAFHDNSTNPSRFTVPAGMGGKYLVTAHVYWAGNATGERWLEFHVNGVAAATLDRVQGDNDAHGQVSSTVLDVVAGDYVEVISHQNSGGSLNIGHVSARQAQNELSFTRLDSGGNIGGEAIGAKAYNNVTQSISTGTWTALTFDSEDFDTDSIHSTVSNTSRLTVPTGLGGKWVVIGNSGTVLANSTGVRNVGFQVNGSWTKGGNFNEENAGLETGQYGTSAILDLDAGDYVELMVYQTSGGNLDYGHASSDPNRASFQMARLDAGGGGGPAIGAKVYNNTTQALSTGTPTDITFNSEDFDTDGFHDTGSNTDRFTIPAGLGGKYLVTGFSYWEANGTGVRAIQFNVNGSGAAGLVRTAGISASDHGQITTAILDLNPGDYVEVNALHNRGSNLNIGHASARQAQNEFSITRIDSQDGDNATWEIDESNGTITNIFSSVLDLLLGGTATTSSKFGFLNVAGGTPTASISANSGDNALYLSGDGNITTTNMQTLTLGGSSTGNVVINAGTNVILFDASDTTLTATGLTTINTTALATFNTAAALGISATTLNLGNGSDAILGTTSNSDLTLTPNGTGEITLSTDFDSGVNIGADTNTPAALSVDGSLGSNATLIVNQPNSGDIIAASSSGTTQFRLKNDGSVNLTNYTDCTLKTDASGDVTCGGITASTSDAIGAEVTKSADQTDITASTATKVTWNTTVHDTNSIFDDANDRLTVPAGMGGKWMVYGVLQWQGLTTETNVLGTIYKNDSSFRTFASFRDDVGGTSIGDWRQQSFGMVMDLAAGDYIHMSAFAVGTSTADIDSGNSYFGMTRLDSGGNVGGEAIGAKVYNNAVQSVSNITLTSLTMNTEDFDTDNFHSTSSNTERITIPAGLGGKYIVTASSYLPFTTVSAKQVRIRKNGTDYIRTQQAGISADTSTIQASSVMDLVPGDYIETVVYHDFGSAKNVGHASARATQSELSVIRLTAGGGGGPAIGVSAYHNTTHSLSDATATALL